MSELNLLQYCDDGKKYSITRRGGRIESVFFNKRADCRYPVGCTNGFDYMSDGRCYAHEAHERDIISVEPVIAEQPKETKMKTKYTLAELKFNKIAINAKTYEEYKKFIKYCKDNNSYSGDNSTEFRWSSYKGELCLDYFQETFGPGYCDISYYKDNGYEILTVSEFFLEDEVIPEPIPTEYKCLVDATKEQEKQIAEFESVLANIKIEAMKLNGRDFKKLIKVLKEI